MNAITKTGLLGGAAAFLLCSAVFAQEISGGLFKWTDKDGVVHLTDRLDKVPKEYRSRTERIGVEGSGGSAAPEAQSPAPSTGQDQAVSDDSLKAQWQARMLDAKRRLQYAEDKYRQLIKRKSDLQAQWGASGAALPPKEVLDELNQIDSDIAAAKQEADKARDLIDNVIPDEARRAGIPPGWLREVE